MLYAGLRFKIKYGEITFYIFNEIILRYIIVYQLKNKL
jgi:hypothetical protein